MVPIRAGLAACPQATETTMEISAIWEATATGGVRPPMEVMPSTDSSTQETPMFTATTTTLNTDSLSVASGIEDYLPE